MESIAVGTWIIIGMQCAAVLIAGGAFLQAIRHQGGKLDHLAKKIELNTTILGAALDKTEGRIVSRIEVLESKMDGHTSDIGIHTGLDLRSRVKRLEDTVDEKP